MDQIGREDQCVICVSTQDADMIPEQHMCAFVCVCVYACDEMVPYVSAGVSGYSAESIHSRQRRMKMSFETEHLQSHVCCLPCVPTQCACEPIRARLPGQTKRAAA